VGCEARRHHAEDWQAPLEDSGCNMLYVQTALLAPHAQHAATLSKRVGGQGPVEALRAVSSRLQRRFAERRLGLMGAVAQVADAFREHLKADEGAEYDQMIEIDLNELQPQARPGSCSLHMSMCMPAVLSSSPAASCAAHQRRRDADTQCPRTHAIQRQCFPACAL